MGATSYLRGAEGAQAPGSPRSAAKNRESDVPEAKAELLKRVAAAQAARTSGDPAVIAAANQRLIALALRELGQLRLLEAAYPQSIELQQRALTYEDTPDLHVDLAIAELQAGRLDEALGESRKALNADAGNVRANIVQGRALMGKQQYGHAAEYLARAAEAAPTLENQYTLAVALLQSKDLASQAKAALVFQQMVKEFGDSGSLHVLFGRAYRDAQDMPDAVSEMQRAVVLDTRTPHAHYFLGLARLSLNEWKPTPEVHAEFEKEVEYFPKDFLANYMLGFLDSTERRYDESDRYLEKAKEINPLWPESWLYLGLNAYAQNNMPRAEEMLRKAIELTGNDEGRANYQVRRAYVDLGRILVNSGRAGESEVYLAKARSLQNKTMEDTQQSVSAMALAGGAGSAAAIMPISPKNETEAAPLMAGSTDPFAPVDAAVVAQSNLTDKERAAADAQEARLRAVLGLGFNDLATSEAVRKEYSEALGHYQEAEKWDASIEGLAKNLGVCAFRAGNYPEAIRGLRLALAQNSGDAPVRGMLGMSYFATDQFGDAVKAFAPLGLRGEQDSAVGYAWAASLVRLGELKPAAVVLAELEKDPLPNDTLVLVGQLWLEVGDYTRAAATFHRVLQADAAFLKAHYFAGQAYIHAEQWPEATAEFQAELAIAPGDLDAKFNLGFVDLQQSKTDDAKELFEQVIAANPDYANAQYELGKILLDRAQVAEAIGHLETAARLSPQTDYIHYQLQAAYRKASRTADADRELNIYKELKAQKREKAASQVPM
jgi:tetratricopeptide (TPR) repeat protein